MILWTVLGGESEKEEKCPFVFTEFSGHYSGNTSNTSCDPIRRQLAVFQQISSQAILSQAGVFTGEKKKKSTSKLT